jgi:fused-like protein
MIYSDQDLPASSQSLRILSNLVAAGVFSSIGQIDELISELLLFIRSILAMKSAEVFDLLTKVHHLHHLSQSFTISWKIFGI